MTSQSSVHPESGLPKSVTSPTAILTWLWQGLALIEHLLRKFLGLMTLLLMVVTIVVASPQGCLQVGVAFSPESVAVSILPLEFWKIWRNVLYLVFIVDLLVFVVVRWGHLKRGEQDLANHKLNSLIKLLLWITFSYALTGLIVDFMFILKYFYVNVQELDPTLITGCWYKL